MQRQVDSSSESASSSKRARAADASDVHHDKCKTGAVAANQRMDYVARAESVPLLAFRQMRLGTPADASERVAEVPELPPDRRAACAQSDSPCEDRPSANVPADLKMSTPSNDHSPAPGISPIPDAFGYSNVRCRACLDTSLIHLLTGCPTHRSPVVSVQSLSRRSAQCRSSSPLCESNNSQPGHF